MTAKANYLACDLGASSGRAVLGMYDGRQMQLEEVHRFDNSPTRILDSLNWDVLRLFEEIKTGLAKSAQNHTQLDGIGIDTWGVDYGLLTKSGDLLGLPYHYRDRRTQGMFDEAFKLVPRAEIYAQTGIQFMELNTLYQLLATAKNSPALLDAADTLLFMPNLLNYWLTGIKSGEYTIAGTSQLYDMSRNCWAKDLIKRLGLPARIMPEVTPPGTVLGDLLPSVIDETGIHPTAVIAPACHDTASAVAAIPVRPERGNWAYISSGTWSLVGAELNQPIINTKALESNFTNEGGICNTIRFLRNIAGLWLVQECRRTWVERGDTHSYQELTRLAEQAPTQVSFVDPDDPRFAHPGDMPRRIQDYCAAAGQPVPQTKGEIVRCALESLALKYCSSINLLEQLIEQTVEVIHIVGGGVNNILLCQLTADTTGKLVIAGPAEATAAGNILIQALARGRISSLTELRQVIANSTAVRLVEPDQHANWNEPRQRFESLSANRQK